jgi:hypothetical protein
VKISNIFIGIAFLVIIIGLAVLYRTTLDNRAIGRTNTAYVRVLDCIISKNAVGRSQEDIEHCYDVIEREFNTNLTRYDQL